jgi:UDP-glucose 4-epimerase
MILITGGMGFIGLHTARRFVDNGEDVVITYYNTWREPSFIANEYGGKVQVEKMDVTDPQSLLKIIEKHNVTSIVHLVVPGLGVLSPGDDFRVNTNSLLSVLEATSKAGLGRLTLASSIAVYMGLAQGPWTEDTMLPTTSSSATEAFKKAEETLGFHYADRADIDAIALRINVNYGPLYHSMSHLPSRLTHAAVNGVEPEYSSSSTASASAIASTGIPYGGDTIDLSYIKDCAKAIHLVHTTPKLNHRIYNVGTGAPTPYEQVAEAVKKVIPDANLPLQSGTGPTFKLNGYMSTERLVNELGFKPDFDLESGISDYITWLRAGNNR